MDKNIKNIIKDWKGTSATTYMLADRIEKQVRKNLLEEFGEFLKEQDVFDSQEKMIKNIIAWRIDELEKLR